MVVRVTDGPSNDIALFEFGHFARVLHVFVEKEFGIIKDENKVPFSGIVKLFDSVHIELADFWWQRFLWWFIFGLIASKKGSMGSCFGASEILPRWNVLELRVCHGQLSEHLNQILVKTHYF